MVLERVILGLYFYFVRDTLPLTLSCILIKMVLESLSISERLAASPYVPFDQKNRKMHWTKQSEKSPSLLTKTEKQRQNWRKPANRARHKKLAKFAKPKIPTSPLQLALGKLTPLLHPITSQFVEKQSCDTNVLF